MALRVSGASPGPIVPSALLAYAQGVDLNTAGDTQMTFADYVSGGNFIIDEIVITNASTSLTTVTAGVYSAISAGGEAYMATAALAALTAAHLALRRTLFVASTVTGALAATTTAVHTAPFVHIGTPQGGAASADFYVYGRVLPS